MPEHLMAHNGGGYAQGYGGKPGQGWGYGGQQQQYHGGATGGGGQPHQQYSQEQQQQEEIEKQVKKYLPKVLKYLKRNCCTVM